MPSHNSSNQQSVSTSELEKAARNDRLKAAQLAARAYIVDGMDLKEIRERWPDIMPSERTLQKWRKKGFGNAGIPWDEARLRVVSRIESATTAATIEELKADAREALHLLMERFRAGRGGARFADLPAIAEFLLKLESLDQSKIDFMKTFVREAARILAKHIDDPVVLGRVATELDALVARLAKDMLHVDALTK